MRFLVLVSALALTVACGESSRRGGGGGVNRSDGGVRPDGGGNNNGDGAIDPDGGGGGNDGAPIADSGCGDPCGEQNANCGFLFDNCFASISCGTCPSGQVCGGGGEPNMCSADCVPDCPSGWSCGAGICGGGSRTTLDLDLDVPARVTISGTLRKNNAAISEQGCVNLSFSNLNGLGNASAYACSDNSWQYSVELWAGDYQVNAYDSSGIVAPSSYVEVLASQSFGGSMSNFNLNMMVPARVTISGVVRRNGAVIPDFGCASLTFANQDGLDSGSTYACSETGWAYTVELWAGDYIVYANDSSAVVLPANSQKVVERAFTSSMPNFTLDVPEPARLTLSGTVRKNGAAITEFGCVQLSFYSLDGLDSPTAYACQESNYSFNIPVIYAGDYRITAYDSSGIVVPFTAIEVSAQRTFNSSMSGLIIDVPVPPRITVSGTVRKNGAPIPELGCAYLSFNNLDGLGSSTVYACYENNYAYTVELYAGRHNVTAYDSSGIVLPVASIEAVAERDFSSTMQNFTIDVRVPPLVTVSGRVLKNGQTITAPVCITLYFNNADGLEQRSTYACGENGASYSIELYAGTYDVLAYDSSGTVLPASVNTEVLNDRAFTSSMQNVNIDVPVPPLVTVSGRVLKNGQPIPTVSACVSITFSSASLGSTSTYACGKNGWTYSVELFAGVHRVSLYDSSELVFPSYDQVVVQNIRLE